MSDHDNDTCPHLVRASLLEAENARLKAEVERCFELVKAVKNERKSAVFKEGVWYVPVEELKQKEADCLVLKAEVARLRASSFVTAVPVEQYERVIKAGDAMEASLSDIPTNDHIKGIEAAMIILEWRATKEGKPIIGCFVNHNKVAQYLPKPPPAKEGKLSE